MYTENQNGYYKRVFCKVKDVVKDEELIVKDGVENLVLVDFSIFNETDEMLEVIINESDEVVTIKPEEGFLMGEYPVFSCVVVSQTGTVKYAGLY